ncbi:3041_t:CDS:2 [Funneliformis geosporum]|uniref:3041_t:CDS:1 n=1 Tax=Funneliformis geosporum TaxID=1117311 RepID=A0A9W4WIZ3_9GLOM|nr:3041_t:CDS:2 [Funneliformis geosporum]
MISEPNLPHSFLQSTIVFEQWEGQEKGIIRSPAIIEYNDDYSKIIRWGTPVLKQLKNDPDNPNEDSEFPREIYTFQVFNSEQEDNWLPPELSRKKLISDYLSEIQKVIVSTIQESWPGVKPSQETGVLFIVPDKWGPTYCNILSQCLLENRLLCDNKENIQFISRGKAIALNCLSENKGVLKYGDYFLIVEIDRDTINLTAREYMSENTLDEIHDRKGDYKEDSSIEKRFLTSQGISNDISIHKNTNLKQIYQTQLQIQPNLESLIKKFQLTGKQTRTTRTIELGSILPSLKEMNLELNKWCIELDLKLIADLFDPLSDRLQRFINTKFKDEDEYIEYSVIFFVGNIFKILLNGALEFVQDNTLYPVLTSLLRKAF